MTVLSRVGACGKGRAGLPATSGFTLIELMVVVAVVAILAAIAYPSYQEQLRKSRRGQAKADLVEYAQLAERHHAVNNTYEGFTVPLQSPREGTAFYGIALSNLGQSTFTLTATPQAGGGQAKDRCGVLAINQAGVKTHTAGSVDECQFGSLAQP
ncbi:type IV pilin protein [Luteimonas huabeiensis]|uniref:type IV pilin protein n=1 Tax=Luteimonas huabeiensis TaxID=1244513 RepID=UPI000465BB9F|nr:type IV pilin protein [Luteimonas huabeiensis]